MRRATLDSLYFQLQNAVELLPAFGSMVT